MRLGLLMALAAGHAGCVLGTTENPPPCAPAEEHRIGGVGPGETNGELIVEMQAVAKGACFGDKVHWLGLDGGVRRPLSNQFIERTRVTSGSSVGGRSHWTWAGQAAIEITAPTPASVKIWVQIVDGGPASTWDCATADGKSISCQ